MNAGMNARLARTLSGSPVTCDGCCAPVEHVTDSMKHPAPVEEWGPNVVYIVCAPLSDGSQPCLDRALINDGAGLLCPCKACIRKADSLGMDLKELGR